MAVNCSHTTQVQPIQSLYKYSEIIVRHSLLIYKSCDYCTPPYILVPTRVWLASEADHLGLMSANLLQPSRFRVQLQQREREQVNIIIIHINIVSQKIVSGTVFTIIIHLNEIL